MRNFKIGISSKISAGFAVIVIFTIIVSCIKIISFKQFNRSYTEISQEKIPAAIEISKLIVISQRLMSNAPDILLARSHIERESIIKEIIKNTGEKNRILIDLKSMGIPAQDIEAVDRHIDLLTKNLNLLNRLSNILIDTEKNLNQIIARLSLLSEKEDTLPGSYYKDKAQIQKYADIKKQVDKQINMIFRIQFETDVKTILDMENRFISLSRKTGDILTDLPVLKDEPVQQMKKEVDYYGKGEWSAFKERIRQINFQNEIKENLVQNKFISSELGRHVDKLYISISEEVSTQTKKFEKQKFVLSIVISIIPILTILVAVMTNLYIRRSIVRRILTLERCMHDYAKNSNTEIPVSGNDEISSMAESVLRFIKQRREYEKSLKHSKKIAEKARVEAESANRAKSIFLANMSHEIRTPMNAVLGFTEILKGMETNTQKANYIDNIHSSGKTLLKLINDILDLSKIEAGKLELQYSPISVNDLFNEMKTLFHNKIKDKGLQFIIEIDKDIPQAVLLDKIRVHQILLNLISNAVKFTYHGHIRVSAKCNFIAPYPNTRFELILEIEDTGIGIAEDQQIRIFETFEQAKDQKTEEYGGTGLGLAITRQLVEMMNGNISLTSKPGKGSCFCITLPDIEVSEGELLLNRELSSFDNNSLMFEKSLVLISDDIDFNRELLTTFLKPFEFDFIYAENGKAAVEAAKKNNPDLILLDMKMPVMDGYEASGLLKKLPDTKDIPIIAVTASALKEDEEIISRLCDAYLRKPVSRADLVNKIMQFIPHSIEKRIQVIRQKENFSFSKKEIKALPETLKNRILENADMGDIEQLEFLISELRNDFPDTASLIQKHLEKFEFELIINLLQPEKNLS